MSSAKERMSVVRQEEIDRYIAQELGIAVSDLKDHPYQLDEDASDDGVVYGWAITWDEDAPPGIKTVGGVTSIRPHYFEEPEGPED